MKKKKQTRHDTTTNKTLLWTLTSNWFCGVTSIVDDLILWSFGFQIYGNISLPQNAMDCMHLVCAVATSYSAAQPMEFHRVRWLCSRLWPLNTMHNRCTDYVCVCVVYEYIIHTIPEQACAVCSAYIEEKKTHR